MSDPNTPAPGTTAGTSSASADDLAAQVAAFEQESFTLKAQIAELNKKFSGIDPEEVKTLKNKVKDFTKAGIGNDPKKLEEFEANIKADYDKQYGTQLEELRNDNNTKAQQLKELQLENTAIDKASQVFKKDMLPLIKREVLAACDFRDGQVVILKEKGEIRKSPRNPQVAMTIDEFILELCDRYPSAVEGKNKAGGMNGSDKRASIPTTMPVDFSTWTRSEQVEFMKKNPEIRGRVLNGGI